jgi:hypothetical protein
MTRPGTWRDTICPRCRLVRSSHSPNCGYEASTAGIMTRLQPSVEEMARAWSGFGMSVAKANEGLKKWSEQWRTRTR